MKDVFDAYARYYDLLYSDKDYAAETAYLVDCLRRHAPGATNILELGCGTGAHAEQLARAGYRVHGIDQSEVMLARAESRKAGLEERLASALTFRLGDARSCRESRRFDVVLALFHVMSYQTSNEDVAAAFRTAAEHLAPGGVFLFDFWYGPAVLTLKPEVRVKRLEDDAIRVMRLAEPEMHPGLDVVDVNYTMFVEAKATGATTRLQETHRMRYFFLPELEQFRAGLFDERDTHAWLDRRPLGHDTWAGTQVLARRGEA